MSLLAASAAVIGAAMLALWVGSLVLRDASIVDVFWGLGFVLVAALGLVVGAGWLPRRMLVAALVAIWGVRLAIHLARRRNGSEDFRYRAMRRSWGSRFALVSLVTVFALQGALMWIVSLPVQGAQMSELPPYWTRLDLVGAVAWAAGFACEAVADRQLRRFRADPANAGRVLDHGLWAWSRHPNYFGDAVVWWGFWLLAAPTPAGLWSLPGPLVMTALLRRVSGVPMLEPRLARTRPGYADYVRRTSPFVPWPPRPPAG